MKSLILIRSFLKEHRLATFLLAVILAVSIFLILIFSEQYAFMNEPCRTFRDADLQNTVYFHGYFSEAQLTVLDTVAEMDELELEDTLRMKEGLLNYAAFNGILEIKQLTLSGTESQIGCKWFSNPLLKAILPQMTEGKWFTGEETDLCAVLCGEALSEYSAGDVIPLSDGSNVRVIGRVSGETFLPDLHGSVVYAQNMFSGGNMVIINGDVIRGTALTEGALERPYCFIGIKPDAPEAEKQELLDYLTRYGSYTTYETIAENTKDSMHQWMTVHLPFPCFLLLVTTVCFLAICTVILQQSMNEQAKYMLMGCTKRRSVGVMTGAFALVFGLPAVIAFAVGLNFREILLAFGAKPYQTEYLVNAGCVVPVLCYLIFLFVCIVGMPVIWYARHSPMSLYVKEK